MSWLGPMMGDRSQGLRMLLVDIIKTRASICASTTERHVDRHLVAVEVRIEGRADQRVKLDRLPVDQDRLEGLHARVGEASARGSADTGCSWMTSARMSQTSGCSCSTIFLAALMVVT